MSTHSVLQLEELDPKKRKTEAIYKESEPKKGDFKENEDLH